MFHRTIFRCALLAAGMLALAGAAGAYELRHSKTCGVINWYSNPTFRLSSISFDSGTKRGAVEVPGFTISQVGDQDLHYSWGTFGGSASNKNKHNDIYAAPLQQADAQAIEGTTKARVRADCHFKEVDIVFNSHFSPGTVFGEPGKYGLPYWRAGTVEGPGGRIYLQIVALHELLHAAGLQHENSVWSATNYGDLPWRTGTADQQMSPLPDDRRGLRKLYPTGGAEYNVAVLNTYVEPGDLSDSGVLLGKKLCFGSGGNDFSPSIFGNSGCGYPSTTSVCPGDRIYTRFSIANDSTVEVEVKERLHFSTDNQLSPGDLDSSTIWLKTVNAGRQHREGHSFVVPPGLLYGAYYSLIVELDSDLGSEWSMADNWIPIHDQRVTLAEDCH